MDRSDCAQLEDIPNVGPAIAVKLRRIGVAAPADLAGRDPYALFATLEAQTSQSYDPCLLDVFIAAVRYMDGGPAQPWWAFTAERKKTLAAPKTF